MYYYLESSAGPNPFDDYHSTKHPGKIPNLRRLTVAQYETENIDTTDELEWGNMMSNQRNVFLQKLVSSIEMDRKTKTSAPHFVSESATEITHRYLSQQPDSNRIERPFLYYIPSNQQAPPPKPQSKVPVYQTIQNSDQERTMFQHAWHIANASDPLVDSDEEFADHHARLDYLRRLNVITRIRERPPTLP